MDSVILSDKSNIPTTLVRIVLFKECRLKERQLLFDSNMSKGSEIEMSKSHSWFLSKIPGNRFSEEYNNMSELIFGSTAMRFNGTTYKIHSMRSTQKLLYTQVFPTPFRRKLNQSDTISKMSNKSFLGSYNSEREDPLFEKHDSIASDSSISIFRKSESDRTNTISTIDSGFTEQSFNSIPTSESQFSISTTNCSSDALLKSYSRIASYQSESSDPAITPCSSSQSYTLSKSSYSRIGLAIVITVPKEQNVYRQFSMYYAYFIENILCRIRQSTKLAINSVNSFLSVMNNITEEANSFMDDLFKYTMIKSDENANFESHQMGSSDSVFLIKKFLYNKLFSLAKITTSVFGRNPEDESFKTWCRLLGTINTKEKNFFLSTLLTAILTIHHGWISTCYNMVSVVSLRSSYNALWYQLLEYYGSFGLNQKISKIVLHSDSSRNDVIQDIVQLLRYFIRYFRVQRREIEREYIKEDEQVNWILSNERRRKSSGGTNNLSWFVKNKEKSTLTRTKTFSKNLVKMASIDDSTDSVTDDDPVIFILGDNEKLINLKEDTHYKGFGEFDEESENSYQEWIEFSSQQQISTKSHQSQQVKGSREDGKTKMKVISFPLPRENILKNFADMDPYEFSLEKKSLGKLAPDYILQSNISHGKQWQENLKSDFLSDSCSYSKETNAEEVVAILGKIDDWKVQLVSSKRSMKSSLASDTVDISHLVADMLEVTEEMSRNCIPKHHCLTHIEQRLLEICWRSKALANLLLTTDFCTMDYLISTLHIEVNDVPLLMSVASTICPEITKKYGISYQ